MTTAAPGDGEPCGLSSARAARLLAEHGANELPHPPRRPPSRRVLAQLRDPLVLVLLVAAAVTVAVGDHTDTLVILLVVALNTAVGVGQEVRADRAVDALARAGAPQARVRRDGAVVVVPARDVVPGDVLVLAAGDLVAADATVVREESLHVDESTLTGESVPVGRRPGDTVPAGGVVTRGRGEVEVTATGAASRAGRTARLLATAGPGRTPLQRRMAALGRRLALAAGLACAVVVVLGLLRGVPPTAMIVAGLSLAVAAVPESLPVVVTLGLALGARRMAARDAVVRGLPAVETLGEVTLLAVDKTGTLTRGRLEVVDWWTPATVPPTELALAVALCNDAPLAGAPDVPGVDPTETALATWAGGRLDVAEARLRYPRTGEEPFESARRRMTTRHDGPRGGLVAVKGAPEVLLGPDATRASADERDEAARWAAEAGARGLRILAAGLGRTGEPAAAAGGDAAGGPDVALVGLVALLDPAREHAGAALAACRSAGIRPVMVTGDHPATAATVASVVGLGDATGTPRTLSLDACRDDVAARTDALANADVLARTRPEQKLALVRGWQERGEVVAMTGDGVNDGPALRQADIGVAMGGQGTEVAAQAADLVLADDDLMTLVAAVEEGRRIHANVRRFLGYALSGGLAEVLVMLAGPLLGVALPLLPAQILWINLLTHGLPGVAFGAEPAEPGLLDHPPRRREQAVVDRALLARIAVLGSTLAIATLATLLLTGDRSAAFLALGLGQLGIALGLRGRRGAREVGRPWLVGAVAAACAAQIAAVLVPPLRAVLATTPPAGPGWAAAALTAGGCGLLALALRAGTRPGTRATSCTGVLSR